MNILLVNWQDRRESAGGRRGGPPVRDLRTARGRGTSGATRLLRLAGRRGLGDRGRHRGAAGGRPAQLRRCWAAARCAGRSEPSGPTCWSRTSTSFRSTSRARECLSARSSRISSARRSFRRRHGRSRRWSGWRSVRSRRRIADRRSTRSARARGTIWSARGIPAASVRVIHPGVDSTRLTPDPAGRREPAPTFLYVGRLKRYKGIGLRDSRLGGGAALSARASPRRGRGRRLSAESCGGSPSSWARPTPSISAGS